MDVFLKVIAGVLVTLVLCLSLAKHEKDYSLLLTIAVCCMVMGIAVSYLEPVLDFFSKLQDLGQLNNNMLEILVKAVGIGLLSEIAGMICSDAGNAALGNTLKILTSAIILWLSIPLLTDLIELIENILVTT